MFLQIDNSYGAFRSIAKKIQKDGSFLKEIWSFSYDSKVIIQFFILYAS